MVQYIALETDCRLFYFEALSIDLVLSYHVPSSFEFIFCSFLIFSLVICWAKEFYGCFCFDVDTCYDVKAILFFEAVKVFVWVELLLPMTCVYRQIIGPFTEKLIL